MAAQTPSEPRSVPQQIERLVVAIALIGLVLTGLPQRYAAEPWARTLMVLGGGVESMRILHRFFALLLIVETIYHVLMLLYRWSVYRQRPALFSGLRDAITQVLTNLGVRRAGDAQPNYAFTLRLEYLIIVLGVVVLGITGLILWNPIAATTFLPGEAIPIAHSVHSDHALFTVVLLVLLRLGIVFLWRARRSAPALPDQMATRRFLPVALVIAVVATLALALFLTSEQTAISTVPRQRAVIFAPQTIPETGDTQIGAVLWETMRCAFCHGADAEGGPRGEPSLHRPDLTFDAFYQQVRVGRGDMPAFTPEELPDGYLIHLWTWLKQSG